MKAFFAATMDLLLGVLYILGLAWFSARLGPCNFLVLVLSIWVMTGCRPLREKTP